MLDKPEMIGNYRILGELARGGMGIVYKAIHPTLKRQVVLKKLTIRGNSAVRERFKREAQILLDLHNQYVVHMFDYFVEGNHHYIVLEYVDGMSLDKLLKKKEKLSCQITMLIFRDACRALKFAHDSGVVHRDIKPGNILLSKHGDIKLADFGIASSDREKDDTLTQEGVTLGTPTYMPPEQFGDTRSVDKRADIYAMGIMLYEMVTGKKPFAQKFSPETYIQIQKGKYIPPQKIVTNLPSVVKKLIRKMTRVKANRRYQSIDVVLKATEKYLAHYDIDAIKNSLSQEIVAKDYKEPIFLPRNHFFHKITSIAVPVICFSLFIYAAWNMGYIHKYLLRSIYTPVSINILLPQTATENSDLPVKAFFFINDNDILPELDNCRRVFFCDENSKGKNKNYSIKPVYVKPGDYRVKVVTGSYVWWQSFSVGKDSLDVSLNFLENAVRPLNIHCLAKEYNTYKKVPNANYSFLINGEWIDVSKVNPNDLLSGSVVKVKIEADGYQSEQFSLLIEWFQEDVYINALLKKSK